MTRNRAQSRHAAAVLTAAVVLAGCGGGPAADRSGAATPAPTRAQVAAGPNDEHAEFPSPPPEPTFDAASRRAAVAAAETVMRAFARPGMAAEDWWAELSPLLSATAREAYQGADPAEVPAREVAGPAKLVETASAYLASVSVPTDVGAYLVLLSRAGAGEPWLAERLIPPTSPQRP